MIEMKRSVVVQYHCPMCGINHEIPYIHEMKIPIRNCSCDEHVAYMTKLACMDCGKPITEQDRCTNICEACRQSVT